MRDPWNAVLARLGKTAPSPAETPAGAAAPVAWDIYGDLADICLRRPVVIAQLGQSLDGRIATASGHSHYINGPESLDHLHRLRAIADAVIVGTNTAVLDNPRLTTRRVPGPNPVRVVLDPNRRLPQSHALLAEAEAETLIVTAGTTAPAPDNSISGSLPAHCDILSARGKDGRIDPALLLERLRARGLRTILVEGGGQTISEFLARGLLDRLHIAVAPMLVGSGRPGLVLPEIETLEAALRFEARTRPLGSDILFDCRLT